MANITVHNEFHFVGFHLDDVTFLIETSSMASPTITVTLCLSAVVRWISWRECGNITKSSNTRML